MGHQEFRFPDNRMDRRKVDFQLSKKVKSQHVENTADKGSLQSKTSCDLRKSLAWDSAFLNSPGLLDPDELLETLNFRELDTGPDITDRDKPLPLPYESSESSGTSRASCVRQSLAWDSAFFTNPGLLDGEELSLVNRGFRNPEMMLLPGAEEDTWKSADSNSTVTSCSLSLASLELDLFDDIRASAHKSHDASSTEVNSVQKPQRDKGRQISNVSKVQDASSTSRVKHATSSGGCTPSARKPPKISNRFSPSPVVPSKRPSTSAGHVKTDSKATKSSVGKNMVMSKKMCLRESTPFVRSPSSILSAYGSANITGKSASNFASKTRHSPLVASGSSFRTPSKHWIGRKSETVYSIGSASSLSTPKSSTFTSSASSIKRSSSASPLKQLSDSPLNTPFREVFDSGMFKLSSSERLPNAQSCLRHETSETKLTSPQMCISPTVDDSRKLTPSGLRMPSPRLGYFDEGRILTERKRPSRDLSTVSLHRFVEHNKENIVSLNSQVDVLSKRMGAISFPAGSK